ncbi:hypothetical protein QBC38DRAFT_362257 [Podospora fimiseda]|uniref:Uncharacterized protein n=1 Tax=Podospora fimiseda TaxID=252190 RepID=A0AAN7GW32_9PEZI|nr:hypothetical protein QBC38DRAFT_362257 [Podospora fimiseda]
MAFIQDPRMRQRWNQISHTTEAVTENAAAGIWTFGHRYITPCFESLGRVVDSCMGPCIGDREERARRARERDRGARRTRAEYSFDFYDDWDDYYDEQNVGGGAAIGGSGAGWSWGPRSEDWDRLLAGTGASKRHHSVESVEADQPRRKRGMSYGTRGPRRKASGDEDPNVIPRTAPLGFLGRLPFKIVGSLRYKPSAANLRDHPGGGGQYGDNGRGGPEEHEPLLGGGGRGNGEGRQPGQRKVSASRARSNTAESGDTSSSYRSRGDLFPSDGEGDEDAVPLDEEQFTVALDRVDDRSSNKTRSSKGKRRADGGGHKGLSRTVSRTTISSGLHTPDERRASVATSPFPEFDDAAEISVPSLEELQQEEERVQREEDEEIERRRRAASQLALKRGLSADDLAGLPDTLEEVSSIDERENQTVEEEAKRSTPLPVRRQSVSPEPDNDLEIKKIRESGEGDDTRQFVPARLPHFG